MQADNRKRGPKGFILLEPGNIVQILPEDNKSWLTLFYSLPEELVLKRPAYTKKGLFRNPASMSASRRLPRMFFMNW